MKLLLQVCLLALLPFFGQSQVILDQFTYQNPAQNAIMADEATFELQRRSKVEPVLTTEEYIKLRQMVTIERRDHEGVYILYSPFLTVYIPSRDELKSK